MKKVFQFQTTIKATEVGDDGVLKIEGFASTNDVDRAGDVIVPEAWTKGGLDNYKKNPILLFNHNYNQPIGTATEIVAVENGLKIKASIVDENAGKMINAGVLRTFSVGFGVKDAMYDSANDLYYIKDVELYEISVVSVPCNQDAVFSVAKSFSNDEEYSQFKKEFVPGNISTGDDVDTDDSVESKNDEGQDNPEEKTMTPEEIRTMIEEEAAKLEKARVAKELKAKEAEEAKTAENIKIESVVKNQTDRLMADIEKRFSEKSESLESIVGDLKSDLKAKSEEITKMRESKRIFDNRDGGNKDWKKSNEDAAVETFILGQATRKGWGTDAGKRLIEKVNVDSGVEVSTADFEQLVSTTVERDVQNDLILAPMFREMIMQSATQILPILPDAGYAEFAGALGTQTAPKGNLDSRDAAYGNNAGVDLTERSFSTKKLISTSYLGNETEEDAILPLLPLLRESMVRSHSRAVEQAILAGNHADGVYGVGGASFDGLLSIADGDANQTVLDGANFAANVLTAAQLMGARKNMGKYGIRPEEVVYIVSQRAYFELIEDAEFQDMNLVGADATKLKGSVGQVYGSQVVMCDEFAAPALNKFCAVAVNKRNFVVPRLRGMRLESEYSVKDQRQVLVATQRLGFSDMINASTAVWGLQYAAA